jgi:uncharacterized DUF497 family protein
MELVWDDSKRQITLEKRNLDFSDAISLFSGFTIEQIDDRYDYGEDRFVTIGMVYDRSVIVVWTPRGGARRIISMKQANVREETKYRDALDRSG